MLFSYYLIQLQLIAYGVQVLYCDKRSTGRRIIEILRGEYET